MTRPAIGGRTGSHTMKSYTMLATAGHATIELRDAPVPVPVPVPEPGPRQMLVRMRAASLNRGEFILGHGLQKPGTSKAIGVEGAGPRVT